MYASLVQYATVAQRESVAFGTSGAETLGSNGAQAIQGFDGAKWVVGINVYLQLYAHSFRVGLTKRDEDHHTRRGSVAIACYQNAITEIRHMLVLDAFLWIDTVLGPQVLNWP